MKNQHIVIFADFVGDEAYGSMTPQWGHFGTQDEAASVVREYAKVEDPQPGVYYIIGEEAYNDSARDMVSERIAYH